MLGVWGSTTTIQHELANPVTKLKTDVGVEPYFVTEGLTCVRELTTDNRLKTNTTLSKPAGVYHAVITTL